MDASSEDGMLDITIYIQEYNGVLRVWKAGSMANGHKVAAKVTESKEEQSWAELADFNLRLSRTSIRLPKYYSSRVILLQRIPRGSQN